MSRLTKQYEDTKRYYSTHTCDEVLQKLGKLEDKEEPKKVKKFAEHAGDCPNCDRIVRNYNHSYCPYCGQRLDWS